MAVCLVFGGGVYLGMTMSSFLCSISSHLIGSAETLTLTSLWYSIYTENCPWPASSQASTGTMLKKFWIYLLMMVTVSRVTTNCYGCNRKHAVNSITGDEYNYRTVLTDLSFKKKMVVRVSYFSWCISTVQCMLALITAYLRYSNGFQRQCVSIGLVNSYVPSTNKPLHHPILTQIYDAIWLL